MTDDDKALNWCSEKLPCARYEALSAENERLREALRSAIRNIENLTYDIKCHTECAECQSNVAMYEHAVEEYRAALGETK